jgi:hypothetical protein
MGRLDVERQKELEPKRIEYAKEQITALGLPIIREDGTKIIFEYKGNPITIFPYSGWHSGKGIQAGRGIEKLIKQLKSNK